MPDHDEHKIILRLCIMGDRGESLGKMGPRRVGSGQGVNMSAVAGSLEQFVQVFGVRRKPLIVVRFAAKSRDGYVIDTAHASRRGDQGNQQAQQE